MHGTNIKLFADLISERLDISCDALSGANIASEVARDRFSETTIGVRNKADGPMWLKLFSELRSGRIDQSLALYMGNRADGRYSHSQIPSADCG